MYTPDVSLYQEPRAKRHFRAFVIASKITHRVRSKNRAVLLLLLLLYCRTRNPLLIRAGTGTLKLEDDNKHHQLNTTILMAIAGSRATLRNSG